MTSFVSTSSARLARGSAPRFSRIGAPFARVGRWLRDMNYRNAVMNELDSLSDRELADIGLARGDIPSVFEIGSRRAL